MFCKEEIGHSFEMNPTCCALHVSTERFVGILGFLQKTVYIFFVGRFSCLRRCSTEDLEEPKYKCP